MSVIVLHDSEHELAVLYCDTEETSLAGVFFRGTSAREEAESFLAYLHTRHNLHELVAGDLEPIVIGRPNDPRSYTERGLRSAFERWRELALDSSNRLTDYGWSLMEWLEGPDRDNPPEPAPEESAA